MGLNGLAEVEKNKNDDEENGDGKTKRKKPITQRVGQVRYNLPI